MPADSRVGKKSPFFKPEFLSEENLTKARRLQEIASRRGQSLAQMSLAWCLRDPRVTTVLIGASRAEQIEENVAALKNPSFTREELEEIDRYATESGINLWKDSSQ